LKEVVGAAIIPSLLTVAEALTKLVEGFMKLPSFVQKGIVVMLALVALAGPVLAFVGTVVSAIGSIAGFVGTLSGIGTSLAAFGPALAGVGAAITGTLLPAIGSVLVAAAPIILIIAAIIAVIYLLYLAWKNNFLGIQDITHKFLADLKSGWENVKDRFQNIKDAFRGVIEAFQKGGHAFTLLFEDGSGALLKLATAFGIPAKAAQEFLANIYSIFDRFRDIFVRARDFLVNAFAKTDWGQVGKYILFGLANGMLFGLPTLLAAAARIATSLLAQIKRSLGISSPSREAMKLGMFTGQGYMLGLMNSMDPNALARMVSRPVTNTTNSQQQIINNNFAAGLSVREVRSIVDERNEDFLNTMTRSLGGD
jgi:hypothetical protein